MSLWIFPTSGLSWSRKIDAYYAAQRGDITLNFSIGAGGFGQFCVTTASADSGVAVDTKGNVCFYSTICPGIGADVPLQGELGLVGSAGTGALCEGAQESKGAYWAGGEETAGQGQITRSSDGNLSIAKGFLGVGGSPAGGVLAGAGVMKCQTTYVCAK